MAKKKIHRTRSFTIPLTIIAPLGASFLIGGKVGWGSPLDHALRGEWKQVGDNLVAGWTGYDVINNKFDFDNGARYLKMLLVGTVVHLVLSQLGVNRILGRAGVPFFRI